MRQHSTLTIRMNVLGFCHVSCFVCAKSTFECIKHAHIHHRNVYFAHFIESTARHEQNVDVWMGTDEGWGYFSSFFRFAFFYYAKRGFRFLIHHQRHVKLTHTHTHTWKVNAWGWSVYGTTRKINRFSVWSNGRARGWWKWWENDSQNPNGMRHATPKTALTKTPLCL